MLENDDEVNGAIKGTTRAKKSVPSSLAWVARRSRRRLLFRVSLWYEMVRGHGNVLRSPPPVGSDTTQVLIFLAGLPVALATGIGPHAREHKADALIGVGFTLSMLYLFSLSIPRGIRLIWLSREVLSRKNALSLC